MPLYGSPILFEHRVDLIVADGLADRVLGVGELMFCFLNPGCRRRARATASARHRTETGETSFDADIALYRRSRGRVN